MLERHYIRCWSSSGSGNDPLCDREGGDTAMVSTEILMAATDVLLESEAVTTMICAFGLIVVIVFSVFYMWQHSKEGRP